MDEDRDEARVSAGSEPNHYRELRRELVKLLVALRRELKGLQAGALNGTLVASWQQDDLKAEIKRVRQRSHTVRVFEGMSKALAKGGASGRGP